MEKEDRDPVKDRGQLPALIVHLVKEKETANTVMFQEVGTGPTHIGRLYVQKAGLKRIGNPKMIQVVIREA